MINNLEKMEQLSKYKFKIGQKLLTITAANEGKTLSVGDVVIVTEVYVHEDSIEPTYYIKDFEVDYDGEKQVFPHRFFIPLMTIIR